MRSLAIIGVLALATAPLSAQSGNFRTGVINAPNRLPSTVMGQVLGQEEQRQQGQTRRKSDRIPPGHLPPAGMCRIWIDGVPPGQQPAATDCQTAVATKPANARVIWGDQKAFPGKANGKFDKSGKGKNKVKHKDRDRDRDRDDDNVIFDRDRRGGVLGSAIPSGTQQESMSKKAKGKGKGRG